MDQRHHPRVTIPQFSVDASDGMGFFQGTISDVSRSGFCMTDLPNKINTKVRNLTVIVSGHKKNFKMIVRPKWAAKESFNKSVGVEIDNPPIAWTNLVMRHEPQIESDAWGTVRI